VDKGAVNICISCLYLYGFVSDAHKRLDSPIQNKNKLCLRLLNFTYSMRERAPSRMMMMSSIVRDNDPTHSHRLDSVEICPQAQ